MPTVCEALSVHLTQPQTWFWPQQSFQPRSIELKWSLSLRSFLWKFVKLIITPCGSFLITGGNPRLLGAQMKALDVFPINIQKIMHLLPGRSHMQYPLPPHLHTPCPWLASLLWDCSLPNSLASRPILQCMCLHTQTMRTRAGGLRGCPMTWSLVMQGSLWKEQRAWRTCPPPSTLGSPGFHLRSMPKKALY